MSEAKEELAAAELVLHRKYPHVVVGSLREIGTRDGKFHMKRNVQIKCTFPECETLRRVATSDLAQVKLCEEHTRVTRLQRRRDARIERNALKYVLDAKKPVKVVKKPVKVAKKPLKTA